MAGMRVHELAKEFDMTSKELLARLADMKIPAKSHASILQDAYVEKIRKNLEPEIKQRAGKLEEEEAKKLAEEMNVPLLGQIPIVQSICEGGDNGTPVALDEDSVTGRAFLSLAASVVRQVDRRNVEMAPTKIVEMHK